MNIRKITDDMDDEDRNVAHAMNAREYYKAGNEKMARNEVASDMGFMGTYEEWVIWLEGVDA